MSWSGRKVLVTGAEGFIGSHLCEALVHRGAGVTAFVRYTARGGVGLLQLLPPDVRSALRVVAGDLRDPHALYAALSWQSIVFHLAALIGIPYSYVHPTEVAEVTPEAGIDRGIEFLRDKPDWTRPDRYEVK
jgi:dTDP-glucose 4,6-dehydratase